MATVTLTIAGATESQIADIMAILNGSMAPKEEEHLKDQAASEIRKEKKTTKKIEVEAKKEEPKEANGAIPTKEEIRAKAIPIMQRDAANQDKVADLLRELGAVDAAGNVGITKLDESKHIEFMERLEKI